jgi:outer membrane murein-binding lipoprotein Lpp
MNENDFEKIDSMVARHVGVFADSMQHKLDLVVEGHQMLAGKLDRVETRLDTRMDCLEHKIDTVAAKIDTVAAKLDAVATDLSAHRRDTEAHPPLYKVKESSE